MALRRSLELLRVIDRTPSWMTVITIAVGGYGAIVIWLDPSSVDSALGTLLLWQMLGASRGFVVPASAGYFDPILLVSGRAALALAHGIYASAPVTVVWLGLGLIESGRGSEAPAAFEAGRLSALLFVSATVWALSLPAPRLITGSLWLVVIVLAATTRAGLERYAWMLTRGEGAVEMLQAVPFVLVCPFVMFETALPGRTELSVSLLAGAALSAVGGITFITRRDYPLEPAR